MGETLDGIEKHFHETSKIIADIKQRTRDCEAHLKSPQKVAAAQKEAEFGETVRKFEVLRKSLEVSLKVV